MIVRVFNNFAKRLIYENDPAICDKEFSSTFSFFKTCLVNVPIRISLYIKSSTKNCYLVIESIYGKWFSRIVRYIKICFPFKKNLSFFPKGWYYNYVLYQNLEKQMFRQVTEYSLFFFREQWSHDLWLVHPVQTILSR